MTKSSQVLILTIIVIFSSLESIGQKIEVRGVINDSLNRPISNVLISVLPDSITVVSDDNGSFSFDIDTGHYTFQYSHLKYNTLAVSMHIIASIDIKVQLIERVKYLEGVTIEEELVDLRKDQHLTRIAPKNLYTMPSATGDFSKILSTLPGVSSNSELSTVYSVRGGSYDENLIYVNGIKIYRPQIVSSGRQEGLSFINPNMVRSIQFSAGGWRARYGDKLSSALDVSYREPLKNEAVVNLSLLGGSLYYGGVNKKQDLSYIFSIRHKNSKYLLGTLETKGQYLPKFTDFQSYISKRLSAKTKIGLLTSVAINNYRTVPEFQQTDFGTFQTSYRFSVDFEGQEKLDYNTYQIGGVLTHSFAENIISNLSVSGVRSSERENFEVEGGYLLCDLNTNPGSSRFNECAVIRGIGTNYSFGRNKLEAQVLNVEQRNEIYINNDVLEFGASWDYEVLDDRLQEFTFVDSANFSRITRTANNEIGIQAHKLAAFIQYTLSSVDSLDIVNMGVRTNYSTFTKQWLVSPRFQYAHRFGEQQNNTIKVAFGVYQQHPFYRELRNRDGEINNDVKAQSSIHFVSGWDRYFNLWGRPFKFSADAYYKYMWSVNLYDVDNIKIRYFGNNDGVAYAYGADFRINGEFIPGSESWFSFGYLDTREAINRDSEFVRRPTDQRINIGILFQDHMPNDPSLKVSLNLLYGSGLPFGPPAGDELRNSFKGGDYTRVDIGFSKSFDFTSAKNIVPNSLWLGVEILNLLAAQNTISYTWIQDVQSNQFAVPNSLSSRFFNLRMIAKF